MNNKPVYKLARAAIVVAAYAVLTIILYPIGSGWIQVRVSEAMTLLPMLFPETAFGLFVGCIISNVYGGNIFDIIFGSLATLIAGLITAKIKNKWLAPLPPIICNGLIVGIMLAALEGLPWYMYLVYIGTVAAGEAIACYALSVPLIILIEKTVLKNK